MVELTEGSLTSRMPVKRLHFAPNEFLHAASVVALAELQLRAYRRACQAAARPRVRAAARLRSPLHGDPDTP